jgi:phage shock protein PspC (stress-responsive transcriptional regulator)
MNDRLYRTVDDRVLAGVCGGLAVRFGLDPSLVRIGYAIVALITGIFPLLVLYVIMAAVVPEQPTGFAGVGRPPSSPPGPDAVPGWVPPGSAAGWSAGASPADAAPGATAGWSAGANPADAAPGATAGWDAGEGTAAWPSADAAASPADVTVAGPPPVPALAPPPGPAWPPAPAPAPGRVPERRRSDPLPAIIGGIILVSLGVYFLLRDQLEIDWSVVWPAGLMAVGVVVILAAFRRRG